MPVNLKKLRTLMLEHAITIKDDYHAPWLDENTLSMRNANKFLLGSILDYQIKADLAWNNARRLSEEILGNPPKLWHKIVNSYSRKQWASKWRPFSLHRFPVAHDRVWRIGAEIVDQYDGDARKIWQRNPPSAILSELTNMRCGEEISRMIVGCLITSGHVKGTGDVKVDIHVKRVLGSIVDKKNLFSQEARDLARKIYSANPWQIDLPLYDIGRRYCTKSWLYCDDCPVSAECITARNTDKKKT